MIYSFGAKNYYSFKEGFEISFELNAKVPKSISNSKKTSNILGIKGANASGKTNILKCLGFFSHFVTRSFRTPPEQDTYVSSHFGNLAPSDFYIDFEENGSRYIYELTATDKEVLREAIYKKKSRKTLLIERKKNAFTKRTAEFSEIDLVTLRSNASFIDTIRHYNLKSAEEDISNVFSFFNKINGNTSGLGYVKDAQLYDTDSISKFYHDNPDVLKFAKTFICKFDLGICDIEIHSSPKENKELRYFPIFVHREASAEEDQLWLTYWEESDGTTALYRRLFQYACTLATGGTLVLDELDTHYHPDLLPPLLDLFLNDKTNPKNAQLIFTSHNLQIMDYLGKYRTYLVSKENGESYCYRLDEIPGDIIRNDRPISTLYRDGKLGGVPKL